MSRAGVVPSWPNLGLYDPPIRIFTGRDDLRGFAYRPVCPLCRAFSWRKTRWSHSANCAERWQRGGPVEAHCTICRVRWQQPHSGFASYFADTPDASYYVECVMKASVLEPF